MRVVKFGGSNLKSKEDLARIIEVIRNYEKPLVVVVSALFGVTDLLIKTMNEAESGSESIKILENTLLEEHREIIVNYIDDDARKEMISGEIEGKISELGRYLMGVHYLGNTPDFAEDIILSYGERLSSHMLTAILNYHGIESTEVLPEEIGLITDGEFGNASVDFDYSCKRIRESLSESKTYVIPGFYGISKEGKITLFGRGGTDYTAASLAKCLKAETLDFWKDVSGFMTADPKIVNSPQKISSLSYEEAAELSYFGAKILHPRSFEPVSEEDIPVRLFNINGELNCDNPLTVINHEKHISRNVIKSVTYSEDFGIIKLKGPGVGVKPGILSKATTELSRANINIKSVITSQTVINILFSLKDLYKSLELINKLEIHGVEEIEVIHNLSLIAVVGEGMLEKAGIAARIFSAVSAQNINVIIISMGASRVANYFVIESSERNKAIKSIHKEFFNEDY